MKTFRLACLALGFTAFAGTAQAQLVVQGKGDATLCYRYALTGNKGSNSAIETCSDAFSTAMSRNDEAATYVNRGILYMRKGNQVRAAKDYESALAIKPNLTEAHVNYAASLIRLQKYDAAISSLDKALVDPDSPTRPEALFNRAIILDHQQNYKAAYYDLKAALTLRPEWEPAVAMISRYQVRPAG